MNINLVVYATTVNASFVNRFPYTRGSWIQTIEINDDDKFNLRVVVLYRPISGSKNNNFKTCNFSVEKQK